MMEDEMKGKRNRGLSKSLMSWGVLTILIISLFMMNLSPNYADETKEHTMNLASQTTLASPGIPPIDIAAPTVFETASFGLG